jgi:hypothetical protein
MSIGTNCGGTGGLRHIGNWMLNGCDGSPGELYGAWLDKGTDAGLTETEKAFDEWYERSFPAGPDGRWMRRTKRTA